MSSYPGGSAWDGGPPGAEAEYAPPAPPYPAPPALPSTDPWTGVSYSQYAAPPYDYQAYGAPAAYAGYSYDSNYYPRPDAGYYDARAYPPAPPQSADYKYPPRDSTRSPQSRSYARSRSYRSKSRSVSPYERKTRADSRGSSFEDARRRRSGSRSVKSKSRKYSSSDRSSSRSRSHSRSSVKNKRSSSSDSSKSDDSYKKKNRKIRNRNSSMTPPLRSGKSTSHSHSVSRSRHSRTPKARRSRSKSSRSPTPKVNKKRLLSKERKSSKDVKTKDKRIESPLPRKHNEKGVSTKVRIKTERVSVTPPPKSHLKESTLPKSHKNKDREPHTPPRKVRDKNRDNSLTPPKSYARVCSSTSRSRSVTPPSKRKRSTTPEKRRSRARSTSSSNSSAPSIKSKSKSKRRVKKSRSASRTRRSTSRSKSRSRSRRRSKSRGKDKRSKSPKKSRSRSASHSSRSRSRSGSGSEDERRGQFTVADRKRFWKLHRNRQEVRERDKSPVKEVKPPPGAVETTTADDIEYGDPPEVEGPNFAELLPTAEQVMLAASSSKSKGVLPIKNDGSFLEMFKKMQEATKPVEEKKPEIKKPALPFIGKRRGGRVLKTGMVKKAKAIDEQTADAPKDAWSLYMQEVKKYRETSCEEERKTRPLVK